MLKPCYVLLVCWMAFALAGCGEKQSNPGASQGGSRLKIGVAIPAAKSGWTAGLGYWVDEAKKHHPNIDWVDLRAVSVEEQIRHLESMMAQKVDALVLLAIESAPLTPAAKKVKERGIYLFSVDRGLTEPIADVFLEGDNRAFGRKSAEFMVDRLKGQGNIVVLTGIPCTVDTFRVESALEVFAKHPGIKILGQQPSEWNEEQSTKVMQAFLTQFQKIDAVWAQDDASAQGAARAIREAGRASEMWIMGGAGRKDVIKEVLEKNPLFPADITYSPAMIAAGMHLCVAAMNGGNEQKIADLLPKHLGISKSALLSTKAGDAKQRVITLDVHLVTPENARDYYFPESVY